MVSDSRLLIENGRSSAAFVFSNQSSTQFLTKVWVEDISGKKTDNVIAVPPVAFSPPGKQLRFQVAILDTRDYPNDKESLFYLHSHSVPGNGSPDNALTVSYDMRLKVFYRPKGLSGNMISAIEGLQWSLKNGVLTVSNPSHFHVSLVTYGIEKDYTEVSNCVIPPGQSVQFAVNKQYPKNVTVRWAAIDDFGSPMRLSTNIVNE